MPTVSVITPVYNRAHTIHAAVASVLTQNFQDYEFLIVDDGSTDNLNASLASIVDPRVRLISHTENRGAAAARNTGVMEAKGQYVAFLDSDDQWLPEKLERQLAFMRSSEIRASCTGYLFVNPCNPEGEERVAQSHLDNEDLLAGCRVGPGSTLMAERALFQEIGPMNVSLRRLEDWDWLLRYTRREILAIVPEVLARIDYSTNSGLDYGDVSTAVTIMKKEQCSYLKGSRRKTARFRGALENELATTAYKNGRFWLAQWHFLKLLWHDPRRDMGTISRIVGRIRTDIFRHKGWNSRTVQHARGLLDSRHRSDE